MDVSNFSKKMFRDYSQLLQSPPLDNWLRSSFMAYFLIKKIGRFEGDLMEEKEAIIRP